MGARPHLRGFTLMRGLSASLLGNEIAVRFSPSFTMKSVTRLENPLGFGVFRFPNWRNAKDRRAILAAAYIAFQLAFGPLVWRYVTVPLVAQLGATIHAEQTNHANSARTAPAADASKRRPKSPTRHRTLRS